MQTAWSTHSAYSDPGRHRARLRELPTDPTAFCTAARNVIGHYRADLLDLPPTRRDEVNSRWLERILDTDQVRHPYPLLQPRPPADRVAGCCRDHSLFVVGAMREHTIPARTRVGFASYLTPGHNIDHVIVESWDRTRWRRTDPGLPGGTVDFDPHDISTGPTAPFQTAAQAWRAYRSGATDANLYCVFPGSELSGPDLVRTYLIFDIAHRYGDELLLWDAWGATNSQIEDHEIDDLATLILQADSGDTTAERAVASRYSTDDRLHPTEVITQYSPFGDPPRWVRLR